MCLKTWKHNSPSPTGLERCYSPLFHISLASSQISHIHAYYPELNWTELLVISKLLPWWCSISHWGWQVGLTCVLALQTVQEAGQEGNCINWPHLHDRNVAHMPTGLWWSLPTMLSCCIHMWEFAPGSWCTFIYWSSDPNKCRRE